jgi:hypothetical protein
MMAADRLSQHARCTALDRWDGNVLGTGGVLSSQTVCGTWRARDEAAVVLSILFGSQPAYCLGSDHAEKQYGSTA